MPRISSLELARQWHRRLADESESKHKDAFVPVDLSTAALTSPSHKEPITQFDLRIELPAGAVARLDHDATDEQQCRLIKNVVQSLTEVTS